MPMIDVFNTDAFSLRTLTKAIEILPFKPSRLSQMGLFEDMPIRTTIAAIEELQGTLSLYSTKPRGSRGQPQARDVRKVRPVTVPHIPVDEEILAQDITNVREFATEGELSTIDALVNRKLARIKQSMEMTWEYLRMGALNGKVYDADGATLIADLFSIFEIGQYSVDFTLGTASDGIIGPAIRKVLDWMEKMSGGFTYDHIHCFAGYRWFDRFVAHQDVKYAYQFWRDNEFFRSDPRAGFQFQGVTIEQYRGSIAGKPVMAPDSAIFFPVGAPGLFGTYFAPADFEETVNTLGIPLYAKQEPLPLNRGRWLHVESNALPICHRPALLVAGTTSN